MCFGACPNKDRQTDGKADTGRTVEWMERKRDMWKRKDKQTNDDMNGWTDEERQIERKRHMKKKRQADK